jgi:DNA-binding FadR family transcriptional regulator
MAYKRIDNSRRAEQISRQLRISIFDGSYPPGQKIPSEHELADAFGVSRIIVREAIRDLEKSGLVAVKRGKHGGAFVQEMKHEAVSSVMRDTLSMADTGPNSILETRLLVEPLVAGLAAERATPDDLQCLQEHLRAEPKSPGSGYHRWNLGFHRLVAQASHNPVFVILVNILLDLADDMISIYSDGTVYHDKTSHAAILNKIADGDIEGVKRLFQDHLLDLVAIHAEWEKSGKPYASTSN